MVARWWTFGVWALVAASAFFWGLRLFVQAPQAPANTVVAQATPAVGGDLTRLLGIDAPPPVAASEEAAAPPPDARFQLIGVVAPRGAGVARDGVALIAVDGKPPKAFRVGSVVTGDTVLQAVRQRGATLGPRSGVAQVALELAPLPAPATGTLPSIGGEGDPAGPRTGMPGQGQPMAGAAGLQQAAEQPDNTQMR